MKIETINNKQYIEFNSFANDLLKAIIEAEQERNDGYIRTKENIEKLYKEKRITKPEYEKAIANCFDFENTQITGKMAYIKEILDSLNFGIEWNETEQGTWRKKILKQKRI